MNRQRQLLGDYMDADRNSFNLVRLVAALAVLISHSFSMTTGDATLEPLLGVTPFSLGSHAVNAFFVLSGLTLAQSLARSPDIGRYVWSRVLRIFPGLFAFGIVLAFIAGPLLTKLQAHEYFGDAHTWLYPFAVLVQFARAVPPHEIFSNLPFAEAANNPLWTIKYEICAYIGLAVLFRLNWVRRPAVLFLILGGCIGTFMALAPPPGLDPSPVYQLGRYGACFVIGLLAYHYRRHLSLAPDLLMLPTALLLISVGTRFEQAAYVLLVAHLTILAGAAHYGRLTTLTQRHDLSYGVYIYHWPVQQVLVLLLPLVSVPALMLGSMAIVLTLAMASWHLIERPALRLKHVDPRTLWMRLRPAT